MSISKSGSIPSSIASIREINNMYDILQLTVEHVKCREKSKYALLRNKLEGDHSLQLELDELLKSFLLICDLYMKKIESDHAYQVNNKKLLTGEDEHVERLTM
jgi:hypothetical protein